MFMRIRFLSLGRLCRRKWSSLPWDYWISEYSKMISTSFAFFLSGVLLSLALSPSLDAWNNERARKYKGVHDIFCSLVLLYPPSLYILSAFCHHPRTYPLLIPSYEEGGGTQLYVSIGGFVTPIYRLIKGDTWSEQARPRARGHFIFPHLSTEATQFSSIYSYIYISISFTITIFLSIFFLSIFFTLGTIPSIDNVEITSNATSSSSPVSGLSSRIFPPSG